MQPHNTDTSQRAHPDQRPELDGHVVLVAAGSRARARALCRVYARAGADIALVGAARDRPGVYAHEHPPYIDELGTARESVVKAGQRCLCLEADILDADEMRTAIAKAVAEYGGVDTIFAVAGALQPVPSLNSSHEWQDELDAFVPGTHSITAAAIEYLGAEKSGQLVLIPGQFGLNWRVIGMNRLLGRNVPDPGFTVTALCPGEAGDAEDHEAGDGHAATHETKSHDPVHDASVDAKRRKAHREFLDAALALGRPTKSPPESSTPILA